MVQYTQNTNVDGEVQEYIQRVSETHCSRLTKCYNGECGGNVFKGNEFLLEKMEEETKIEETDQNTNVDGEVQEYIKRKSETHHSRVTKCYDMECGGNVFKGNEFSLEKIEEETNIEETKCCFDAFEDCEGDRIVRMGEMFNGNDEMQSEWLEHETRGSRMLIGGTSVEFAEEAPMKRSLLPLPKLMTHGTTGNTQRASTPTSTTSIYSRFNAVNTRSSPSIGMRIHHDNSIRTRFSSLPRSPNKNHHRN